MSRWKATAYIFADSFEEAMAEASYLNRNKVGIAIVVDDDTIEYEDEEE